MAGGKNKTAASPVFSYNSGDGWCGHEAVPADQDTGNAVGGGHSQDHLDRFRVIKATVPAHDQCLPGKTGLLEDGLDKVFQVTRLLKYADLLAQSRCARFLIRKWCCFQSSCVHRYIVMAQQ